MDDKEELLKMQKELLQEMAKTTSYPIILSATGQDEVREYRLGYGLDKWYYVCDTSSSIIGPYLSAEAALHAILDEHRVILIGAECIITHGPHTITKENYIRYAKSIAGVAEDAGGAPQSDEIS